jgi:DNA-binding NtrC family response regulator
MAQTILIVDDEKNILATLSRALEIEGYSTDTAGTARGALDKLASSPFDLVLLDVKLPDGDGLEVLGQIAQQYEGLPVIMMSGHGTIETAVRATRLGALDFLEKPIGSDRLFVAVANALRLRRVEQEVKELRAEAGRFDMVGRSRAMSGLFETIRRAAPSEGRVLITGENGTGKELVARAIHQNSKRKSGPFVKVNCAAVPHDLIESELFGHERGAFTGAVTTRRGRFESANGGTLFLDEIGDAPLPLQAKLLRVLQEGEFERVGGTQTIKVDVRVIAATNKDLKAEIAAQRFREDLYYRVNVVAVRVPALRERKEDIPDLVRYFLNDASRQNGKRLELSEDGLRAFDAYDYPGNVRELRNLVERLAILAEGPIVDEDELLSIIDVLGENAGKAPLPAAVQMLVPEPTLELGEAASPALRDQIAVAEKQIILRTLDQTNGNVAETARILDLERSHLYKKMRALGVKPTR